MVTVIAAQSCSLEKMCSQDAKCDSANSAEPTSVQQPDPTLQQDHYFSQTSQTRSKRHTISVSLAQRSFDLVTDRGVFSPKRLDPGTKVLLDKAARFDSSEVLTVADIGAGYGPIACTVAMRAPEARVVAVEINERARELCVENARRLGLGSVEVYSPDEVDAELLFDRICSNPPIRIGKAALHELLTRWLSRLKPDGFAELVVQKHLGSDSLQRWLIGQGWPTTRVLSYQSYRILRVEPNPDIAAQKS